MSGYEGPGEYVMELTYSIPQPDLMALVAASSGCKQFISWQCVSAVIKNPYNHIDPVTYWVDRNGFSR